MTAAAALKGYTIHIADDDGDDVVMLKKALKACGFDGDVEISQNGEELIETLKRRVPDLIVLDLNMPRKSGLETLTELKADDRFKAIPVVVFTTSSNADDIHHAYNAGANSYIVKPMSYSGIESRVKGLVTYWTDCVALPSRTE